MPKLHVQLALLKILPQRPLMHLGHNYEKRENIGIRRFQQKELAPNTLGHFTDSIITDHRTHSARAHLKTLSSLRLRTLN